MSVKLVKNFLCANERRIFHEKQKHYQCIDHSVRLLFATSKITVRIKFVRGTICRETLPNSMTGRSLVVEAWSKLVKKLNESASV